jgi:hypothetical protein
MQPGDPVVGGTTLRRAAIQSPNFMHLISGWSINMDGTAEFNGVTINGGQLILTDGSGAVVGTLDGTLGLVLYGAGTAADPALTITPDGDVVWGDVSPAQTLDTSIEIGVISDAVGKDRIAMLLGSGEESGQAQAVLAVAASPADGSEPPVICPLTGVYVVGSDPSISTNQPCPEVWHALTLLVGWTSDPTGLGAAYRITADGWVVLRGMILSGTRTDGTIFATLPATYRPGGTSRQAAACTGANVFGLVQITSDGNLRCAGITGAGITGMDLTGLTFPLANLL